MTRVNRCRCLLSLSIAFFASLVATVGYAGQCSSCTIRSMGIGPHYDSVCSTGSCVFIMMDQTPAGMASCAVDSWQFVVDTSTDAGRKNLAVLLSAYSMGKPITINGTGSCSLYSAAENFFYAYFSF